jgi:hypothetical protein
MQGKDIAKSLNVAESTVSKDINVLKSNSDQFLNDLAKRTLPFMYQKSIDGINEVLRECWAIYNDKYNPTEINQWHKQGALKLAKECNESLMRLFIEGHTVMAVRKVKDQLNEVSYFTTNGNKNNIGTQGV